MRRVSVRSRHVRPHSGSPQVDRLERSPASSGDLRDAPLTASPVPPRRPIIDPGAVRPESAGHIVSVLRRRAWRSSRPRLVEVQAACLAEGRLESGNRGDAAPLAPFGGTGAAEGVLARFGPTTPTRAGRLADASADPTDACATRLHAHSVKV